MFRKGDYVETRWRAVRGGTATFWEECEWGEGVKGWIESVGCDEYDYDEDPCRYEVRVDYSDGSPYLIKSFFPGDHNIRPVLHLSNLEAGYTID